MNTTVQHASEPTHLELPSAPSGGPLRWGRTILIVLAGLSTAALGLLLLTTPRNGDAQTVRPTEDVTHVEIHIDAGSVTSVAADQLTVAMEPSAGWFGRVPTTTTRVHDGALRVTGSCSWQSFGRCATHVTVALPDGVGLNVRTEAGRIDVTGATAGVALRSDAGPIRVHDITGGAQLRTEAGAIEGEIAQGVIEATSAVGPVTLTVTRDVSGLSARTEVGSVELVVPDAAYAVDAATSLGRTRVEVRRDGTSDRVIRAHSEVGHITVRTNDEGAQG